MVVTFRISTMHAGLPYLSLGLVALASYTTATKHQLRSDIGHTDFDELVESADFVLASCEYMHLIVIDMVS